MKKGLQICGAAAFVVSLLWIVCGWVFGDQLIYSPVLYGDVVTTNWQAIANASIETDDAGTYTNGSYTLYYRVWATNALGRTPYSTNLSVTFSGDADYTNAVRLSWWRVAGVAGYVVEKSYDSGTSWTNWAPVSVGTTSMTDTATTTNVWPGIGSNVVTEIPDGSYPWLTSPLYVTQLEDVAVSTAPVYDTPLVADGSGNWIAGRVIARYISELFDFSTNAGITNGQTITWNGTNWTPCDLSSGSVQTNVIISYDGSQYTLTNNPTAGNDVLTFNQTDSTAGWTANNFATGTPVYVEVDAGITNHIITYDGTIYTVTNNPSGGNDWLTFNSADSTAGFTPNTAGSVQTNVIISVDGTQYTLTNNPTAGNDMLTFNQTDSTAGWTPNNFATGTPVYVEADAGITNEIISYDGTRYTLTNNPSSGNDYLTFNSADSTAGWTPNLSFFQGPLTGGLDAANNYIDGADYFRATNGAIVTNAALGSFKVLPNTVRGYISGREYWIWMDNTNGVYGMGTNACDADDSYWAVDPVNHVLRLGRSYDTTWTRGNHSIGGPLIVTGAAVFVANVGVGGTISSDEAISVTNAVGYIIESGGGNADNKIYHNETEYWRFGMAQGNDCEWRLYAPDLAGYCIQVEHTNGNVQIDNDLDIVGALSKGSGTFDIDHPLSPTEKRLRHGFIEGPRYDLIYRGWLTLTNGHGAASIDAASGMTDGTFEALTRNPQGWVDGVTSSWIPVRVTSVVDGLIDIEAKESTCNDTVSWLVIAERDDAWVHVTAECDEDGHLMVEQAKPEPPATLLDDVIREGNTDHIETEQIDATDYRGYYRHPKAFNATPPTRRVIIRKREEVGKLDNIDNNPTSNAD